MPLGSTLTLIEEHQSSVGPLPFEQPSLCAPSTEMTTGAFTQGYNYIHQQTAKL